MTTLSALQRAAKRDEKIREIARECCSFDFMIEVDEDARVSEVHARGQNGAYVQAWVWVDFSGTDLAEESE